MEKDRDYIAFSQIERGMQNEISTFSGSNTRLLEYIRSMSSSSKTQLNGTLKAMDCLARMDLQHKNLRSADCVYAWMNALIRAKQKPILAMLFRSIDFTPSIYEEFKRNENRQTIRLEKERSRITWFVVLALAIVLGAWMAISVLLLHANFYWMLALCIILYACALTYYFLWWDRKHYIYRLKQLTESMSAESKHFIRSLDVQNLYWRPDLESIHNMCIVSMYPERLGHLFTFDSSDIEYEFESKMDKIEESEQSSDLAKTMKFRPAMPENDLDKTLQVDPIKVKTERKAAPSRKRIGHAGRPVISLDHMDSVKFKDLDSEIAQIFYEDKK